MNIMSCSNCGVVLDRDRIKIPSIDDIEDEYGGIDTAKAIWNGRSWAPMFSCPVCREKLS